MASKSQSERIAAIVKRPEAKAFYLAHGAYSSLLKAWTHVLTNDRLAPMVSPKMRKTVASIRVNIDEVLQEWEMLLAGEEPEAGKEELHALIRDVTEIVLRIANSRTHRRGNESEVQYRPARWFTKGSAPRLRMAAREDKAREKQED